LEIKYPDFFKVNHYKKKSDASLSDKELSLHPSNPKPFFHFKKHKYIPKEFAPDLDSKDMKKLEENKEILYKESRLENQQKKPLKKQLTIKIPEKNKCLEFEMNVFFKFWGIFNFYFLQVLKKVNTMNPDEFLSSTNIKDNESSSLKGTQMLSSLNEISLKNEPTGPLLSLEKKSLLSKNPEENQFLLALLSNNKNLQNLESAANHFYFPLANMPSKEGSIKDDLIRPLDSKNLRTDLATLNSRALNFNEFLQMFTINNSGGDDYLRFLNLNSSRMSAAGLNTGGRLGFGNLTSHGFNATNINQLINNEMDKEEKEKQQKEETQDEGDVLKKKRKLE